MMTQRPTFRYVLYLTAGTAVWLGFIVWIVPDLIERAYAGEAHPWINRLIEGQSTHRLEYYLDRWRTISITLTLGLLATGSAVAYLRSTRGRGVWRGWFGETTPRLAPTSILGVAVAIGCIHGLGELAAGGMRVSIGSPGWAVLRTDLVWMVPLSSAIAFGAIGVVWAAASVVVLPLRAPAVVLFGLGVLPPYWWIRMGIPVIHGLAALLLAGGIAARLASIGQRHPLATVRVVHRALAVSAALVAVGAGVRWAERVVAERQAVARTPVSEDSPNVLLLIMDTVRAHNLSLFGYERSTTPQLVQLARNAIVFPSATAPSPWTLPSHASMLTGRMPHELSAGWVSVLDDAFPTLAEVLRRHGYATAGFSANQYWLTKLYAMDRGFDRFEDTPFTWRGVLSASWAVGLVIRTTRQKLGIHGEWSRKRAGQINARLLRWLEKANRPSFAMVNYIDAHEPYLPPEPFNRMFTADQPRYWYNSGRSLSPDARRQLTAAYDGSIAYVDDAIGKLFQSLRGTGRFHNTLIIVTSDHGDALGEGPQRVMGHGNDLSTAVLHVPLLIRPPGGHAGGTVIPRAVSLRALPATVLAMLELSPEPSFGTVSLWPLPDEHAPAAPVLSELEPPPRVRASDPIAAGDMCSATWNGYHLIRRGDGREALYETSVDPFERRNLVRDPTRIAVRDTLRAAMLRMAGARRATNLPRGPVGCARVAGER